MPLMAHLTAGHAWATPTPSGHVPDGWVGIVEDLVRDHDATLAPHPDASLAIYAEGRLCTLRLNHLLFGERLTTGVLRRVRDAAERAEARSAVSCEACGRPGRLRSDAFGRFSTRCTDHTSSEASGRQRSACATQCGLRPDQAARPKLAPARPGRSRKGCSGPLKVAEARSKIQSA